MRVFFSAGEASGDAYGAAIVLAMTELGAFSDRALAHGLVGYATGLSEKDGDVKSAAEWISGLYSNDPAVGFLSRVGSGSLSLADLEAEVTADIGSGLIDRHRLLSETVFAIGGRRLREAGAAIVEDSSQWGAVGITESLKVVPKVLWGYDEAKRRLTRHDPGLFVPIDFGYVNIKLARRAKAAGWKVLYFVPPGSWRRDKQGADLPSVTDAIVTPFPWSADILRGMGADARFYGHPLKAMVASVPDVEERSGLTLLPGSRNHEIKHNLPLMAAVAKQVEGPLRIGVAPNLRTEDVERRWKGLEGPPAEFVKDGRAALKASRAAVVCSGTATLEAALCRCPMVIVYRVSKLIEIEARIRKPKFGFIGLPNIVLDRAVVPELIQHDATVGAVLSHVSALSVDGTARSLQLEAFEEIDAACGPTDCFEQTARLAIELSGGLP
ncbi:MAG: hypothetical protein JST30_06895 [Armatimonadetes bacterium]|nr:hypothetical protein [Armatimonadota bacterium]